MRRVLASLLLAVGIPATAEVLPRAGNGDPHVQSVDYDPDQVVMLRVAPGFAVTIEFAGDERIENISLGNSAVWQAVPNRRGDLLFVKPMQGATLTNLMVVTDARRYHFSLDPAYGADPGLPYSVKFTYPQAIAASTPEPTQAAATRYVFSGSRILRPVSMSDDGVFTSIVWAHDVPMPAVYAMGESGASALVNGQVRGGAYVIEGTAARYYFRRGTEQTCARRKVVKRRP